MLEFGHRPGTGGVLDKSAHKMSVYLRVNTHTHTHTHTHMHELESHMPRV